jgi:antirestriction protein ArdC
MTNAKPRTRKTSTERRDHYQEVTDRIIAALEAGTKPWRRPWDENLAGGPTMPINAVTGRKYHGINVLVLAMSAFALGNGDPRFCSYKQATSRGWQVRGGEKGTTVFFFKRMQIEDRDAPPEAEDRTKHIPLLRAYTVFNAAQIDGIEPYVAPDVGEAPWRRPEAADVILRNSGVTVRIGGDQAFYSPTLDFCQLPPECAFESPQSWAATALHEAAHSTGHHTRLNRDLTGRYGSARYAMEEVRADLASVFMGAELGLPCDIPNHASYLGYWIDVLKRDKREVFRAAADAQKIADYLLQFHPDFAAQASTADETDRAEDGQVEMEAA